MGRGERDGYRETYRDRVMERAMEREGDGGRVKSDLENQLLLKWRSVVKSRKKTGKKVVRIKRCTASRSYTRVYIIGGGYPHVDSSRL